MVHLSQSGNGIVIARMIEVAARNIATFFNTCDVTLNLWPTDIATKSNRKIIKITKESKSKETESGDLVCSERIAI